MAIVRRADPGLATVVKLIANRKPVFQMFYVNTEAGWSGGE